MVTLPKSNSFNEVFNLDLKVFDLKHILWMIDSFSRFKKGKVTYSEQKGGNNINLRLDFTIQ